MHGVPLRMPSPVAQTRSVHGKQQWHKGFNQEPMLQNARNPIKERGSCAVILSCMPLSRPPFPMLSHSLRALNMPPSYKAHFSGLCCTWYIKRAGGVPSSTGLPSRCDNNLVKSMRHDNFACHQNKGNRIIRNTFSNAQEIT